MRSSKPQWVQTDVSQLTEQLFTLWCSNRWHFCYVQTRDTHFHKCLLMWCSNMVLRANRRWCQRRSKVKMLQPSVRHPKVQSYRIEIVWIQTVLFVCVCVCVCVWGVNVHSWQQWIQREFPVQASDEQVYSVNDKISKYWCCCASVCLCTHPKRFGMPGCGRQVCGFLLLIVFTFLAWQQALVKGIGRLYLHLHSAIALLLWKAFWWIPGPVWRKKEYKR